VARWTLIGIVLVTAGLFLGHTLRAQRTAASHVAVGGFFLSETGIDFELHPTESPILVSAVADAPVRVCQVGTSFAGRWRGGCRRLTDRPLPLPETNGMMHVVFRVTTTAGRARVRRLSLRWHCVDHRLGVFPRQTRIPRLHPIFDC
jgi:hypothetical protein